MAQKPSIPKGTRDFSPTEVAKRNYIFNTIQLAFENFGFQPIETPAFEKSSTLLGKYGEEGDRLIFKILNSGDYLSKVDEVLLKDKDSKNITSKISEKALRYDLTVPFARYVVQHQNEIVFPFKRYQMQPVWRADRPQKGRFREFYQCDADVVGSKSLYQEVEFVQLYDEVFTKLGLTDTVIKINNRKILSGIAEIIGEKDKLIDFTVALDKLDKIGVEGVTKEMLAKGISDNAIEKLNPLFELSGTNTEKLSQLKLLLQDSDEGTQGVIDLQFVIDAIEELGLQSANLELDVTLARGLNYYTGAIFEVQTNKVQIGSIGGGGRYDDLTGVFGLKDMSGVGISFGLDRIYIVLEELGLFDEVVLPKPKVVFLNYDKTKVISLLKVVKVLRENNIKCELYPDVAQSNKQQQKQWKYVVNRKIDYAITDVEDGVFTLKNVNNGEQQHYKVEELIKIVQNS
jgi:histidyl-tRNA synthetase